LEQPFLARIKRTSSKKPVTGDMIKVSVLCFFYTYGFLGKSEENGKKWQLIFTENVEMEVNESDPSQLDAE
jgi:hypothetical protein